MLDVAVKSAGMTGLFDHVLSVDAARAYKPSPRAYALGTRTFDARAQDIVFVSSNGWDVAGAGWFGYTTFWINRANAPTGSAGHRAARERQRHGRADCIHRTGEANPPHMK